jgi:serine/threonine protein phosphatase PrpC
MGGKVEKGRINGNKLSISRAFGNYDFKNPDTLEEGDLLSVSQSVHLIFSLLTCDIFRDVIAGLVTVTPDVKVFPITRKTDFILIACDGFWYVRLRIVYFVKKSHYNIEGCDFQF